MQIAYHLGAHGTDEDRLVRGLMRNRGYLAERGIAVPAPRLYRQILPKIARSLRGSPAGLDAQQVVLDAVLEDDPAAGEQKTARIVFSNENLVCFPVQVITQDGFYTHLSNRVVAYSNLFPHEENEFFLGLRGPATLIPALIQKSNAGTYEAIMSGRDPLSLRWSAAIRRIYAAAPGTRLTVWCDEDTPLIWPEVVRAVAGLGADDPLDTDFDVLSMIMTTEGLQKLKDFVTAHPPRSAAERRRIVTAFLDKYAAADELELDVPLPGWTDDLVQDLSETYQQDCAEIAAIPGVRFITP
ncbi:MAG: hypothetical protein R3E44_09050 [Paracoccaceae bacterium]